MRSDIRYNPRMKRRLFPLSLVLLALTLVPLPARIFAVNASTARPISAWNFDWDDNVLNMPTKIMVWDKVKKAEIPVSTSQWVFVKNEIGKSGEWKNCELRMRDRRPEKKISALFWGRAGTPESFSPRCTQGNGGTTGKVAGPELECFRHGVGRSRGGKEGHAHHRANARAGNDLCGIKRASQARVDSQPPSVGNIYPVANIKLAKKLGGSVEAPASAKAKVMEKLLTELNATPFAPNCPEVINREGNGHEKMHLWVFSDDDYGNISTARADSFPGSAEISPRKNRSLLHGPQQPESKNRTRSSSPLTEAPDHYARKSKAKPASAAPTHSYSQALLRASKRRKPGHCVAQ